MIPKGTILDVAEVVKGDYRYRGHILAGNCDIDRVILYSSIPVGANQDSFQIKFMCPGHFVGETLDVREQIDTELMKKWKGARLPFITAEAKELGAMAFGLPHRTSPYHQAA